MKTAQALMQTCAALAVVATTFSSIADARQMHAGINYARYLKEKEVVADELDAWLKKYSDDAEINGWLPQAESRDADEVAEDRKQRFFMAKELVEELSEQNPGAEFSIDSPFSLMTTDEFSEYVKNSYLEGTGRQLRGMGSENQNTDKNAPRSNVANGNGQAHSWSFRDAFGKWWGGKSNNNGDATRAMQNGGGRGMQNGSGRGGQSGGPTRGIQIGGPNGFTGGYSFSFEDIMKWLNDNRPGGQPGGTPSNRPRPPMPAPAPPAPAPAPPSPPAPAPAPAPPSPPVAPQPAPTRAPVVAPTEAPSGPVGPVAPVDTPGAAKNEDVVIGGDGTGVDWSTNKCMPPVQNQGQCGSCWSFATIAGTEVGKCLATKASSYVKLSEQQLATCDTRNMGCQGGATVYAYQYIQQNGVCSGADVPYTMSNGRTAACNTGCNKVDVGIKSLGRAQGETGLVKALDTQPVVIAVAAGNAAWKQYKSGVMSTCQTTQVDHAVLAVGYDATTFKIRNSWGANWGEGGYVRMKRDPGATGTCSMYRDMIYANF